MRLFLLLLVTALPLGAQRVLSGPALKKLVKRYLAADEPRELLQMEQILRRVPPLSRQEANQWIKFVARRLVSGKPRLARSGTHGLYDEKKKLGKYIVTGSGNHKGLVIGLHGGGVGSADCRGAASAWGGAISSLGLIGLFPQAMQATEAAWGDDITIKFVMDLLAAASRTFKFDHNRVYVVGHSMGGYGAWTLGGRFADRWAGTVSFAGGPTCVGGPRHPRQVQVGVLANRLNSPMFIYHSVDDPRVPIPAVRLAVQGLLAFRREHPGGYVFKYQEVSKRGHAFPKRGPRPALKWITAFKRNPRPRQVVWEVFYPRPSQSYWLDATQAQRGDLTVATWDGKNSFRLESDAFDPAALGVLLDDRMTDLDQRVRVWINKKQVFSGVPSRSLMTLLRSARRRRDPELLFVARVP